MLRGKITGLLLFTLAILLVTGCGDDEDTTSTVDGVGTTGGAAGGTGTTGGTGMTGGTGTTGGTVMTTCTPATTVVDVSGEISESVTWTADTVWNITESVFVTNGAVLTIEPCTVVTGNNAAALVITTGGRIEAVGTATTPIVFTSSQAEGSRAPGDWGGVVLLGRAQVNVGETSIEGLEATETRGLYGGSDNAHNCGSLQYVRIEFAGFLFGEDNELNGLTVGGCGTDTTLQYIQVHRGLDDAFEFFGGTVNASYLIASQQQDESYDMDQGYQGNIQYAIAAAGNATDQIFEIDNNANTPDLLPRTSPVMYNFTIIGPNNAATGVGFADWRRGSNVTLRNSIVTGFKGADMLNIGGAETAAQVNQNPDAFTNWVIFDVDILPEAMDDDGGFDEVAFFTDAAARMLIAADPMLNADNNNFQPAAGSAADAAGAMPPAGFDAAGANFHGAIDPNGTDWTQGWTAYPEN